METKLKERPRFDDVLSRFVVAPEAAEVPEIVHAVVIPKPKRKVSPRLSVPQSTLILANAKMNGWEDVRKVGQGDMIDRPIETNGWLVMPIEMYTGIIPPEAIQHAEILTMGVQIKGLLVADDIQHVERQSQTMPLAAPSVSPDWEKWGRPSLPARICAILMGFSSTRG